MFMYSSVLVMIALFSWNANDTFFPHKSSEHLVYGPIPYGQELLVAVYSALGFVGAKLAIAALRRLERWIDPDLAALITTITWGSTYAFVFQCVIDAWIKGEVQGSTKWTGSLFQRLVVKLELASLEIRYDVTSYDRLELFARYASLFTVLTTSVVTLFVLLRRFWGIMLGKTLVVKDLKSSIREASFLHGVDENLLSVVVSASMYRPRNANFAADMKRSARDWIGSNRPKWSEADKTGQIASAVQAAITITDAEHNFGGLAGITTYRDGLVYANKMSAGAMAPAVSA